MINLQTNKQKRKQQTFTTYYEDNKVYKYIYKNTCMGR